MLKRFLILCAALAAVCCLACTVYADWGEAATVGGHTYYIDAEGTATAEIQPKALSWLRHAGSGKGCWYAIENRYGFYGEGLMFHVREENGKIAFSVTDAAGTHSYPVMDTVLYVPTETVTREELAAAYPEAELSQQLYELDGAVHAFTVVDIKSTANATEPTVVDPNNVPADAVSRPQILPTVIVVAASLLAAAAAFFTIRRIRKNHKKIHDLKNQS